MDCGLEHFNTDFAGDVTDMIKDICEAEEKMAKAKYYCALVSEMGDEDWVSKHLPEHKSDVYGYSRRFSARQHPRNAMGEFKNKAGYPYIHDPSRREDGMDMYPIHPYDEYKDAKRYYTETKDTNAKAMMDVKTKESADEAIHIMKDIWADADPELKKSMKAEVTNLLTDMSRM